MKLIPAALVAAAAFAQSFPRPDVSALKTYLNLTDAQVTSLQAIRTQQRTALSSTHQQLQQKQQSLNSLLSGGSTDPNAVGQLVLDIQALRKQVSTANSSLQAQAVSVLTADQKTKLNALQDAAKLQPAIREAEFLFLLAPPTPPAGGPGDFGAFGRPAAPGFHGRGGPAMFGRQL